VVVGGLVEGDKDDLFIGVAIKKNWQGLLDLPFTS